MANAKSSKLSNELVQLGLHLLMPNFDTRSLFGLVRDAFAIDFFLLSTVIKLSLFVVALDFYLSSFAMQ